MSQDEPSHIAPEGASCAEHPDRVAQFTCPRCNRHACITCFHPAVARCARCLRQDPTEAAPPLPFETKDGNVLTRFVRTLGTAFLPSRTAPAMAYPDVAPARTFFYWSSLPLAMLAGVIPYTRTLEFGNMRVLVLGKPMPLPEAIALDVARAIGAQLVLSGIELLCLLLPFVSLVAAYAPPERRSAATRVVLYRFWLAPAAALVGYIAIWISHIPPEALLANAQQMPPMPIVIAGFIQAALRVFQILALTATARIACGLSIPMSLVVVGVPLILQILAVPLAAAGLDRVLPAVPTQR